MCNRVKASFEFRESKVRWNLFNDLPQYKPIHNVAPGRKEADILTIVRTDAGNEGRLMYWPLVPSFEKDMKLRYSTLNAKAERLRESRTYGRLLQRRRCIIPIDGFYEWQGDKPPKTPYFVYVKSSRLFALAGLWDTWRKPDGNILESFSIITLPPNELIAAFHDRMPAILHPENEEKWLDCATHPFDKVESLLMQFPAELMGAHITSTRVNSPAYNEPDCGAPAENQSQLALL